MTWKVLLSILGYLLLCVVVYLLVGCTTVQRQHVAELGIGHDTHIDSGTNPRSVIRYRWEPKDGASGLLFEFNHHSSIKDGAPFNNNAEDLTNQYSVIWRVVF